MNGIIAGMRLDGSCMPFLLLYGRFLPLFRVFQVVFCDIMYNRSCRKYYYMGRNDTVRGPLLLLDID